MLTVSEIKKAIENTEYAEFGMLIINAFVTTDSVVIRTQPRYLFTKGFDPCLRSNGKSIPFCGLAASL